MSGSKKEEETKVEAAGAVPPGDDDEFGAAFGESADESSSESEAEAPVTERAKEEETDNEETKEEVLEGTSDKKGSTETDTEKGEEDWKHKYESLQGMFTKLQGQVEALTKAEQTEETKEAPKATPPAGIDFAKLAEDDEEVRDFLEEFDYLAAPLQKILSKVLPSGKVSQDDMATILHTATITAAHPEYPNISTLDNKGMSPLKNFVYNYAGDDKDKVEKAYEQGNASEVIWLIDRFKDKKPVNGTNGTNGTAVKKKKLDNLTAVESKEAAINPNAKGSGGDTFEDGFEASAKRK